MPGWCYSQLMEGFWKFWIDKGCAEPSKSDALEMLLCYARNSLWCWWYDKSGVHIRIGNKTRSERHGPHRLPEGIVEVSRWPSSSLLLPSSDTLEHVAVGNIQCSESSSKAPTLLQVSCWQWRDILPILLVLISRMHQRFHCLLYPTKSDSELKNFRQAFARCICSWSVHYFVNLEPNLST